MNNNLYNNDRFYYENARLSIFDIIKYIHGDDKIYFTDISNLDIDYLSPLQFTFYKYYKRPLFRESIYIWDNGFVVIELKNVVKFDCIENETDYFIKLPHGDSSKLNTKEKQFLNGCLNVSQKYDQSRLFKIDAYIAKNKFHKLLRYELKNFPSRNDIVTLDDMRRYEHFI